MKVEKKGKIDGHMEKIEREITTQRLPHIISTLHTISLSVLHVQVVPECQTPCCSSPSGSWSHRWPQALVFPLCLNHLCPPEAQEEDPTVNTFH